MNTSEPGWPLPPDELSLAPDEIHLWCAPLVVAADVQQHLARRLSPDERQRADRFRFPHHRRRYIVCRGILRALLGRYLRIPPAQVQFTYGGHGKPALVGAPLYFNVSHSQELALYAVLRGQEIGVDVEALRPIADAAGISERFFSPRENAVFRSLPPEEQDRGFLNCWTRKEAFIKALGEGLSHPLDRFDVALVPGEPARLLSIDGAEAEGAAWLLEELHPAPGYVGALAVQGRDWRLACWRYEVQPSAG
jgi:4'-phosphopantetheinyl transferase